MITLDNAPTPPRLRARVTALSIGCTVLGIMVVLELMSLLAAAGTFSGSGSSAVSFADSQVLSVFVMTASVFLLFVASLLVHLSRRFDAPEE